MRSTTRCLTASGAALRRLLRVVDRSPLVYTVDDVYKLAALLRTKEDPLGLRDDVDFMRGLYRRCQTVLTPTSVDVVSPFQRALLEAVPAPTTAGTSAAETAPSAFVPSPSTATSRTTPMLQEHINAILTIAREIHDESSDQAPASCEDALVDDGLWQVYVSAESLAEVECHMAVLADRVRDLDADDVRRVARALSLVRYQNYSHTALLGRRACEVCTPLPPKELVQLFFNLQTLHVQDSLTPLVNALCRGIPSLSAAETYQLMHAMEKQPQTNAASLRLVGPLAHHAVQQHLRSAPGPGYHRALLRVLAQYQQTQHQQVIQAVVRSLVDPEKDYLSRARPHDLIVILQCLLDLQVPPATLARHAALLQRLEACVATMDMRDMDNLLDIVSLLPVDSDVIMKVSLERLDKDAGKLTIPQLVFLLDLLASYPPAKGHVAMVSMAFVAAVQAPTMDAVTLEKVLVALASLERFSDDFVSLLRVLVQDKGGFRSGATPLLAVLTALTVADLQANPELAPLLKQALGGVAGHTSESDLHALRKACARLGLADDRAVMAMLSSSTNRGSSARSGSGGWQSPRSAQAKRPAGSGRR